MMGIPSWKALLASAAVATAPVAAPSAAMAHGPVGDSTAPRPLPLATSSSDRIYGRVVTKGGETHTGFIRWTRGEYTWGDVLPGFKPLPAKNFDEARALRAAQPSERAQAARTIDFMGVRVTWDEDDEVPPSRAESGLRFGYVRAIAAVSDSVFLIALRSGEEVELWTNPPGPPPRVVSAADSARAAGAGAAGRAAGGRAAGAPPAGRAAGPAGAGAGRGGGGPANPPLRVTVFEATGEFAVPITEVVTVELFAAPATAPVPAAPVYATVEDRWGMKLSGYIGWSGQGILDTDVITRLEGQPDRRIPFSDVATIERTNGSRGRMVLKSGEEVVLAAARERGVNGAPPTPRSTIGLPGTSVRVADPALGAVSVNWGDIKSIRFQAPSASLGYETFASPRPLDGTVRTTAGEEIAGQIRWDNDEVQGWEMLNGRAHSDAYQVELAQVASIERLNTQRSKVTLRDGRTQELGQQNDVGWGNKGVIITLANGTQRLVEWVDLKEVRFTP